MTQKRLVPPAAMTALPGATAQLATVVTAVLHEPPMHCWPPVHSVSSPQAGGRQMRSSQTDGEVQSEAVVQIRTQECAGVQAHFALLPFAQSVFALQTQFA